MRTDVTQSTEYKFGYHKGIAEGLNNGVEIPERTRQEREKSERTWRRVIRREDILNIILVGAVGVMNIINSYSERGNRRKIEELNRKQIEVYNILSSDNLDIERCKSILEGLAEKE